MPVFDDPSMQTHKLGGSTYGFSAKRIEDLGASEYTLVAIAADVSGSVTAYRAEIEACVKQVVLACRHSPRADNLMLRFVTFDSRLTEVHGFRPLTDCDPANYDGSVQIGGTTALFDAACNAVGAVTKYGSDLVKQDFEANAIVFVITDGQDNASALTPGEVRRAIAEAVTREHLESLRAVLVGVNTGQGGLSGYLRRFKDEAGFDQYVDIADASAKSLAALADFVSRSISSQSQALGSGGPSQTLTF